MQTDGMPAIGLGGTAIIGASLEKPEKRAFPLYAPARPPESLEDKEFCSSHTLHYPYIAGSMAQGISSVELLEALCGAGMLAFYGAAGVSLDIVK